MQVRCHPTMLRRADQLNSADITIVKHCCMAVMQVNWNNIIICDHMNTSLRLPNLGRVSCWSSSDLFVINSAEQYQIRGRVLNQIYEIPVDNTLPNPQHQQIGAAAMAELSPTDYAPPYQSKGTVLPDIIGLWSLGFGKIYFKNNSKCFIKALV